MRDSERELVMRSAEKRRDSAVLLGGFQLRPKILLIRPAQHGNELECTGTACLRCVVIVDQCQPGSPRLAVIGSSLLGEDTHTLCLTIKSEKPDLLRLDKS